MSLREKKFVFYTQSVFDWMYLEPLVKELGQRTPASIRCVTSDPDARSSGLDSHGIGIQYLSGGVPGTVAFFENIEADVVVMTMPDLGRFVTKRSSAPPHYVYAFHSLISTHMAWLKGSYDDYDSILCGGPHHVSEVRASEKYYGLSQAISHRLVQLKDVSGDPITSCLFLIVPLLVEGHII